MSNNRFIPGKISTLRLAAYGVFSPPIPLDSVVAAVCDRRSFQPQKRRSQSAATAMPERVLKCGGKRSATPL